MSANIRLEFDTPAFFSLACVGARLEAVTDLSVTNLSDSDEEALTLEIECVPAFFTPQVIPLGILAPNTKRIFPDLALSYDRTLFSYAQENVTANITVRVLSDGEVVTEENRACELLRHDAWGGVHYYPELLSCLVTPMQTQVQDLARKCRRRIQKLKVSAPASGYSDSLDPDRVRAISLEVYSAIYETVRAAGLIFSIQPPELCRRGATVQLPEVTLEKKNANALDAALLFTACAEALGLHPILVLSASTVLIGGFLEPDSFSAPVADRLSLLNSALADGRICLFEANSLAKGTSLSFNIACQLGAKMCRDLSDFYLSLDLDSCRRAGIPPLDNRVLYEDGIHFEKPGLSDEEDIFLNDTAIEEASPVPFAQNLKDMRRTLHDFAPHNPLLSLPEESRVRILITDQERMFSSLAVGSVCDLTEAPMPFGFRGDPAEEAGKLNRMEQNAAALAGEAGEICLCFGIIRWKSEDAEGEAPLLLLPVSFARRKGLLAALSSLNAAPKLNTTLMDFLSEYFALDLHGLKDLRTSDMRGYLRQIFLRIRSEIGTNLSLTLLDQETFFAFLDTEVNAKLSALTASRLESDALSHAICAGERLDTEEALPDETADYAPVSMPTPYALDREALDVCSIVRKQPNTLVTAPVGGGKTHLGAALAFSALNQPENTVLYITGERADARDVMPTLEKAGIAPLSVMLSSAVPDQVDYAVPETETFPAEEYYTLATEFSEERDRLLSYESILREKLTCGCTPEDAIYCFDHVRKAADCLHFSPDTVGNMSEEVMHEHQRIIHELKRSLSAIGSPIGHPLSYVKIRGFSYEIKAEGVRLLEEYTKKLKEYLTFLRGSCAGMFPHAAIRNEGDERAFLNTLTMIGEQRGINSCFFERETAASDIAKAKTIFVYGKECCEMRAEILSLMDESIFALPVKEMILTFRDSEAKRGGARKRVQREITQKLSACLKEKREFVVLDTLYQLEKYQNYKVYLAENATLIQRLFGVDILAPQNDTAEIWTQLAALCRDCVTFDHQLSVLGDEVRADAARWMKNYSEEEAERAASLAAGILEMRGEMEECRARFLKYLEVDEKAFAAEHRETLYEDLPKYLKDLSGGMDGFQAWTEWLCASDAARDAGFEQVLEAIEGGALDGNTLEDAYSRAFFMALCEYVFLKYPLLGEKRGASFEDKMAALKEKRDRIYDYAGIDIRSKHQRRYSAFVEESGWNIDAGGTLTPGLFSEHAYALSCRYPLLVANACDAVRFLDGTPARFHLLILDDAQTLSMPSALSLIPRADKVVLLGTSTEQTHVSAAPSFWASACTALKPHSLRYSRQSSAGLSDLVTCTCADARATLPFAFASAGVRTVHTSGRFDPEKRVNQTEAMQTVEEILAVMKQHAAEGSALSLGVCASTRLQKLLILKTLAKRLREEPELYSVLRDAREPFYVSALCEEPIGRRDVILWSVTLAPDAEANAPSRADALLNDAESARRMISVLGSARRELCVLHSLHPDMLSELRMCTPAARCFERIMKQIFSADADVRSVVGDTASYDNPITDRIAAHLRFSGCRVSSSVRGGAIVLDLVARLPDHPDFALAVLLDESVYSVCSRHLLGEENLIRTLKDRGFTPYRVRATDWFVNDQAVLESISALLPTAK